MHMSVGTTTPARGKLLGAREVAGMIEHRFQISSDAIADFCRRHHIRRLALFGSVLRDDFGPDSDVDVLVEFEPGHVPGLAFFDMQDELSALIGRQVGLNTPGFLSPYFRDSVLASARPLYVAA
jgi:predicted nucleotidyltransferase